MLLCQHLPRHLLSSSSAAAAFPSFSNAAPPLRARHFAIPRGRPLLLPLVSACSSSSTATESPLTVSFHDPPLVTDGGPVGIAAQAPPLEEAPVRLPLDKLFVPPEVDLSGGVGSTRVLNGSNIVLAPYANDALVSTAEFVKSSTRTEDCPSDGLPEFALVGRSNVGKSSLLNSLVRRKRLALTSKKPGKTQCINHFRINDSWYLVDLPGYGYVRIFILVFLKFSSNVNYRGRHHN